MHSNVPLRVSLVDEGYLSLVNFYLQLIVAVSILDLSRYLRLVFPSPLGRVPPADPLFVTALLQILSLSAIPSGLLGEWGRQYRLQRPCPSLEVEGRHLQPEASTGSCA
jgi:hypothetical protein